MGTGKEQKITITSSTNMSKEDIDRAVKDAEKFAAEDKALKEKVEIKNRGEQLAYQCEKTLSDLGDKVDASEKADVQADCDRLKELVKGEDTDAIKAATESLEKKFYALSEKLYKQQGGGEAGGQGFDPNMGQQGGGQNSDGTYDADFTEKN